MKLFLKKKDYYPFIFFNSWKVEYNGSPGLGRLDDDGWEAMFSAISRFLLYCIRGYPFPLPLLIG